jgi:anthranilate phosphoribosyltransferase
MIKEYIQKIVDKEDLSFEESYQVMDYIMSGQVNNSQLAGFLIGLKSKGETSPEIAGFAKAMRDKSIKIQCDDVNAIDVCGTGGDNSGTFNISTAVAFAAAGAGVTVAKHGNRSMSSKCGSADVLQELGINISLPREKAEEALNTIGITFLFAPEYHPAMKYAVPVRKELGMKTVFNILGPLTNPAGVKKQVIGTFSVNAAKIMSGSAEYLGMEKVCFLCCCDKYDEIFLGDATDIYEYNTDKGVSFYKIDNKSFDYPVIHHNDIKGDSADINARIILDVFENKTSNGAFHTIAANTAIALYCAGVSDNLSDCKLAAEESIKSGAALNKLNQLKNFGKLI